MPEIDLWFLTVEFLDEVVHEAIVVQEIIVLSIVFHVRMQCVEELTEEIIDRFDGGEVRVSMMLVSPKACLVLGDFDTLQTGEVWM